MIYGTFATGPTLGTPGATPDPLHLTFSGVRAGTYLPGTGCPDGIHYDVKGNLWAATARLGGILQIDPRGIILGFLPVPNGDLATTNFAFELKRAVAQHTQRKIPFSCRFQYSPEKGRSVPPCLAT